MNILLAFLSLHFLNVFPHSLCKHELERFILFLLISHYVSHYLCCIMFVFGALFSGKKKKKRMKINESLNRMRKQSEMISSMKYFKIVEYFPGCTQLGYRRCDVRFLGIASHLTGCSHVMILICLIFKNKQYM